MTNKNKNFKWNKLSDNEIEKIIMNATLDNHSIRKIEIIYIILSILLPILIYLIIYLFIFKLHFLTMGGFIMIGFCIFIEIMLLKQKRAKLKVIKIIEYEKNSGIKIISNRYRPIAEKVYKNYSKSISTKN